MPHPTILPPVTWLTPADNPDTDAVRAWQTHLDSKRIGTTPPPDPRATQILHATDALFRSFNRRRPVWERRA